MWIQAVGQRDQEWFPGASRKAYQEIDCFFGNFHNALYSTCNRYSPFVLLLRRVIWVVSVMMYVADGSFLRLVR